MIDIYYYCYYIANRKIFILRNITYKNIKNRLRYLKNKANLCLNPIVNIFYKNRNLVIIKNQISILNFLLETLRDDIKKLKKNIHHRLCLIDLEDNPASIRIVHLFDTLVTDV